MAQAAGFIILCGNDALLVKTPAGNWGFPKGKRQKGETVLDTAWRELKEETGIDKANVYMVSDDPLAEEGKESGGPHYFVGLIQGGLLRITWNPAELAFAGWVSITDALNLDKFTRTRKELLREATVLVAQEQGSFH